MKTLFRFEFIAVLAAAFALTAHAQQTKPLLVSDGQPVQNDDGGQAFIIDRQLKPLSSFAARKGAVTEPQQYSVFVGSGWSDPTLRELETKLGSLLANVSDDSEIAALQALGMNRFGPAISAERTDMPSGVFRDLDAQRLLAEMIDSGVLGRPAAKTIYVIFLDASLQSTLGSLMAGKHYVAYHSTFNSSASKIRYVVVPFESDAQRSYEIALHALVAAATKPAQSAK